MTKLRTQYRLTYPGSNQADLFASQKGAYCFIDRLAQSRAGGGDVASSVTVWVDEREGRGWQLYERVNLADYGA